MNLQLEDMLTALLSAGVGTVIGGFITAKIATALLTHRMTETEKKVDDVIETATKLELDQAQYAQRLAAEEAAMAIVRPDRHALAKEIQRHEGQIEMLTRLYETVINKQSQMMETVMSRQVQLLEAISQRLPR